MVFIKCVLFAALVSLAFADEEPRTKSPVQSVSSRALYDTLHGKGLLKLSGKGCKPVSMWVLARHGVSYPSKEELVQFSELTDFKKAILNNHLKWGSGDVSSADIEELKNWQMSMGVENADQLIESEKKTITEMAKRIHRQFPKFHEEMNVKHTSSPKARDSAAAFIAAIGGLPTNTDIVDDALLLSEDDAVGVNETIYFREGDEMSQVLQNVATRLGFRHLKPSIVEEMYKLCTYDRLLNEEKTSPWCDLFTPEELKVLEFQEDLSTYYTSGYGSPKENQKGCTLLFDLMHRLTNFRSLGRSTIYFAHEKTLRHLLVMLGLEKDSEPISYDNYSTSKDRSWKNSVLTPFNGNIMSVLHRCDGGIKQPDDYYITLYHNENPVSLPVCGGPVCHLLTFVNHYTSLIEEGSCNVKEFVQNEKLPEYITG